MTNTNNFIFIVRAIIIALIGISLLVWTGMLTGCGREPNLGSVQLILDESVGQEELAFDNMIYTAQAGHTYSVVTLKYYLTRIQLRSESGPTQDLAEVVYRDARDPGTGVISISDIPNGEYTSLEFTFGLDSEMNISGGLPNTLENINMEWPIPGEEGYHYMKFEGKYDVYNSGVIRSFNLHLGATGGNQNYFHVSLPLSSFLIDGNDWRVILTMDVNEWIQNPMIYDFETYGPAIMMDQNAQAVLKANGATVFSLTSVRR